MNAPGVALNYQLLRLGALLQLQTRAMEAGRDELGFLIVNETATVVPYAQAALWLDVPEGHASLVLSGIAVAEPGGPYYMWLERVFAELARPERARAGETRTPCLLSAADLPEGLASEWPEWFPAHAVCCPLGWRDNRLAGILLLGRTEPWNDGDRQLLGVLSGTYGQSLLLHRQVREVRLWHRLPQKKRTLWIAAAVLLMIALFPVRESVLAPAEVVPIDPAPVRAPFDGVVGTVRVVPNQTVQAGQVLVSMDLEQLQTRDEVARKSYEMASEEYTDTAQQAMTDERAASRLATLKGKANQAQAELAYDEEMLRRAQITAPVTGVAVFDDPGEWAGKPVAIGERIMMIASPQHTQLQIEVPVDSVVSFDKGSEVVFFSNLAPDEPVYGKLDFASYASTATPDGVMSYAFRAAFDKGQTLRLGLKGTAKIYGPRRMLLLWLIRRPLAVVRAWLSI
jgi:multidrug resistance efflux pump